LFGPLADILAYDLFMKIFAHRGLWEVESEQNSLSAISAAFDLGLSVEIDLWKRDSSGTIWVGHDIDQALLNFSEVLSCWETYQDVDLALNIKCDGLISSLGAKMKKYSDLSKGRYFAFDMSMPERVIYERENFPIAYRLSELELSELETDRDLYWLDSFYSDWFLNLESKSLQRILPKSILVSPELHGRLSGDAIDLVKRISTYGICLDDIAAVRHAG